MNRSTIITMLLVLLSASWVSAQDTGALSLATAQELFSRKVTATGRVQAVVSARISPRVSGHVLEFGKNASGQMLDAGMTVTAGEILFRLNETTFRNHLASAQAMLNSAQAGLANLTAPTRQERIEQLRQGVAELTARLADRQRDQVRFKRLVEQEKTLPARRLEEVDTEVAALTAQKTAAQARLQEAEIGPTKSEIAVAEARVAEAQAALNIAQDDLRDSAVRAPFDGIITRRMKSPGDYLTSAPPSEVLELVAIDKLEVELRVSEAYFNAVQVGKTPVVLHSALLKDDLAVPVTRIVGQIDQAQGTFPLRIVIPPERRDRLVPGAFVTAEILLENDGQVIVPLRAVVHKDGNNAVFVAQEGKMLRRQVVLGDRLTEGIVVKSGLKPGQKVLVGPSEAMKDGQKLPDYLKEG